MVKIHREMLTRARAGEGNEFSQGETWETGNVVGGRTKKLVKTWEEYLPTSGPEET